jgi:uncharacterized protein YyaL (SSP411 family)
MRRLDAAVALALLALAACHGARDTATRDAGVDAHATRTVTVRPADVVRRDGNHLLGAGSAYLLQHSHNPVDWYPWSAETLALARDAGRPIFLSIGYASCHWCHVMEAEVFEDDEVAAFLNEHFVSIKVDREERPDLDAAYMASLEAMTGSGGWPMSLFLTPSLQPFFGATYLPRDRFLGVAHKSWEQFSTARADVEGHAAEVQRRIARDEPTAPGAAFDARELHAMATAALERLDPQWGGFRGTTKFPMVSQWTFLLHAARKWGDAPLEEAVRATLDAMAAGGIHDPIGGGFHRYSTDPRWEVPHFEKMLYDNAQLASLYLEAGAAIGDRHWDEVGIDTLDFLVRDMQAEGGGFLASFDADSGGREGAFYVWTAAQLRAVAGPADGDVLARLLGVGGAAQIDGASVVNRRLSFADAAIKAGSTVATVTALWNKWRPALLAARASRPHPRADAKLVTAWNGLAIRALAGGFEATGDARYRDAAVRAADLLWRTHRRPGGGLLRSTTGGQPGDAGVLSDYAFFAGGLIALFEATGRADLLDHALTLVKEAGERFAAPGGGWYDAEAAATPFARTVSLDDSPEPSGSAGLLRDEVELSALTLRAELARSVDDTLALHADALRRRGTGSAGWLDAALLRAGPFYDVVVAADAGAGDDLEATWKTLAPPWAVVARVPAVGPDPGFAHLVAAAEAKTSGAGRARAFVCSQGACKQPTADPAVVRAQLLAGWKM